MTTYIIRRILLNLVVLFILLTFVFISVRILPGDFAAEQVALRQFGGAGVEGESVEDLMEEARRALGLHGSIAEQYGRYLRDLVRGDFGISLATRASTITETREAFPYTLQLGTMILFVGLVMAIPLGCLSAWQKGTLLDAVLRVLAMIGLAAPVFWTATIGTLVVLETGIFELDILGYPGIWEDPWGSFQLFLIPALAGGAGIGAILMRLVRSEMIAVMGTDFVRTARAKGLTEARVAIRHGFRSSLATIITMTGLLLTSLLSGTIILETMFNIPGMGQEMITSIGRRDVPMVQTLALTIAAVVVFANLVVDIMTAIFDPRISVEASEA